MTTTPYTPSLALIERVARFIWTRDGEPDGTGPTEANLGSYRRDAALVLGVLGQMGYKVTAELPHEPTVIVIRDPDVSNVATVYDGPVHVIDVDLGYAEMADREEFLEWAGSQIATAEDLRLRHGGLHAGADLLEETVMGIVEAYEHGFADLAAVRAAALAVQDNVHG